MAFSRKLMIVLVSFFLLIIILFFSFRNMALHKLIEKQQVKFEKAYHTKLIINKAGFVGLKTIYFSKIILLPEEGDTLFHGDSVSVSFRVLPLIMGKLRLNYLGMYNFHLSFVKNEGKDNYSAFFKSENKKDSSADRYANYSALINGLLNRTFSVIPKSIMVDKFLVSFHLDTLNSAVGLQNIKMENNRCTGLININEKAVQCQIIMNALVDRDKKRIGLSLSGKGQQKVRLPFIGQKMNTSLSFDSLDLSISLESYRQGLLRLNGKAIARGMTLNNKRVAPTDIAIDSGKLNFDINIGDRFFELDSTSFISVNQISFNTFFRYQGLPRKLVGFRILPTTFDSQQFFESLPVGMFGTLEGIKTEGKLAFHCNFMYDFQSPDSLIFDTRLEKENFKIISFGKEDYRKINGTFHHEVYEKDRFVRAFNVGPENPNFTSLDRISPFLRYAILTSEDGDFFYHHGFNERSFRESLADDIKQGRFVRGGSTITMQLVKNVFLTRNKTVSRKLEEALIVWLIENMHLVSKERMYEVYLNIIEFGPGVYGIREGSEFYFKKKPSELNLAESIYLSTIIPRPKGFRYFFNEKGNLKPFIADYFRRAAAIMVRRNQINPFDTIGLKPTVDLKGPARSFLVFSNDSIPEQVEPDDDGF
jgi:hypothetical protein